jgi:hypothetical protein
LSFAREHSWCRRNQSIRLDRIRVAGGMTIVAAFVAWTAI